jgi:hypothetical protein
MMAMEAAVAHGYLSATQNGYADKRRRVWAGEKPRGLTDLARDMSSLGGGVVRGPSSDGPMVH